jgi:hypothetical protein
LPRRLRNLKKRCQVIHLGLVPGYARTATAYLNVI